MSAFRPWPVIFLALLSALMPFLGEAGPLPGHAAAFARAPICDGGRNSTDHTPPAHPTDCALCPACLASPAWADVPEAATAQQPGTGHAIVPVAGERRGIVPPSRRLIQPRAPPPLA